MTEFDKCYDIDAATGCWVWNRTKSLGYGIVHIASGKQAKAHRLSYEKHVGPIPDGLYILHRCNRRDCVCPDHLYAGTQKENMRDAIDAGTHVSLHPDIASRPGEKNGRAKLSQDDVDYIRKIYRRGKPRQIDLAAKYGVDQTTISKIIRGVNWGC